MEHEVGLDRRGVMLAERRPPGVPGEPERRAVCSQAGNQGCLEVAAALTEGAEDGEEVVGVDEAVAGGVAGGGGGAE